MRRSPFGPALLWKGLLPAESRAGVCRVAGAYRGALQVLASVELSLADGFEFGLDVTVDCFPIKTS